MGGPATRAGARRVARTGPLRPAAASRRVGAVRVKAFFNFIQPKTAAAPADPRRAELAAELLSATSGKASRAQIEELVRLQMRPGGRGNGRRRCQVALRHPRRICSCAPPPQAADDPLPCPARAPNCSPQVDELAPLSVKNPLRSPLLWGKWEVAYCSKPTAVGGPLKAGAGPVLFPGQQATQLLNEPNELINEVGWAREAVGHAL
jgi:hypothetical protein